MSHPFTNQAVVLDIEGTTTPISFVHDVLFPYVTNNLTNFLDKHWTDSELQKEIELLRAQASKDVENEIPEASRIPEQRDGNAEQVKTAIINNVHWQMRQDRKIGALKSFQGFMWKFGYATGELKGVIYDDVVTALQKWFDAGIKVYIYSSGSVPAQKLIFGHSDKGDLLSYISGHFDTSIGSKLESQSYVNIADEIGIGVDGILFLSDNVNEIAAAKRAGLQAFIVERPGNMPLTPKDRKENRVITGFDELFY